MLHTYQDPNYYHPNGNKAAHAYYGNRDVTESETTEPVKLFQDNPKGLKITHWNVQCLINKTDQLQKLVYEPRDQPDILGITETWLSAKYDDSFVNMPGYHNPPQRKDRTYAALAKLASKFASNMNKGEITGIILLDLRKAFDMVDHKLLLKTLSLYNLSNHALNWFESYLTNRK